MNVIDYSGSVPTRPGSLIRSVPLDRALVDADSPQVRDARRFLYSSSDDNGKPTLSTAAALVPPGRTPPGGWPVVAWAHGTVGIGDACTPSANSFNPGFPTEAALLNSIVNHGYAIVASDYAGAGTPGTQKYLNATSEGRNVIDSIRAARALRLPLAKSWSVVGVSQGGGAALGTAAQVTRYGADVAHDFIGTVSIAGPANLEYLLPALGPGVPPISLNVLNPRLSLFIALTLAGFRSFYPQIDLNSYLTPEGVRLLESAETFCFKTPDDVGAFKDVILGDMFTKPLTQIPHIVKLFRHYQGSPVFNFKKPILLMHGLLDIDVPIPLSNIMTAPEIGARGQRVYVRVFPTDDHGTIISNAAPETLKFLDTLNKK